MAEEVLFEIVIGEAVDTLLGGLWLMWLMGILHGWHHAIPVMGYWFSVVVVIFLRCVVHDSSIQPIESMATMKLKRRHK